MERQFVTRQGFTLLRRRPALVVLLVAIGGAAAALALQLRRPSPVAVRLVPEFVDLGHLSQLQKKEFKLEVRNDSDKPATVTKVSTSCGCTVPAWTRQTIEPRSAISLPVILDTGHGDGTIERIVTAYVNDEASPAGFLAIESRLRAIVQPDLILMPPRLDLGPVSIECTTTARVLLRRKGFAGPLQILRARTTHECLSIRVEPTESSEGFVITAGLDPSGFQERHFSGEIRVVTNAAGMPSVSIPVTAELLYKVQCDPASLFLVRQNTTSTIVQGELQLKAVDEANLPAIKLRCSSSHMKASIVPTNDEKNALVRVGVMADMPIAQFDERVEVIDARSEDVLAVVPVRYMDLSKLE